jgi:hypothetical protein
VAIGEHLEGELLTAVLADDSQVSGDVAEDADPAGDVEAAAVQGAGQAAGVVLTALVHVLVEFGEGG